MEPEATGQGSGCPLDRIPRWPWWRVPLLFGVGFCVIQILVFVARFGFGRLAEIGGGARQWYLGPISGFSLFFVGGAAAGLLIGRLLRTAGTRWQVFLIVASAVATPFAIFGSLVGGLLGPPGVIVYAVAPYLLLAGIPALVRRVWLGVANRLRNGGSCC